MSVELREATADDLDRWDDYVDRSPQGTLFHQRDALTIQARHADATVHHLVGVKGQEPVGIFPVFEVTKGPITTAFSPPPKLRVPYLGPALLHMDKLGQRKTERRQQQLIDGAFEWLDDRLGPRYLHCRLHTGYDDVRPFTFNDCSVSPTYTYHVDLDRDEASLLSSFSSDARSNIRDGRDAENVTVTEEGREAIPRILAQVRSRYENQGKEFGVPDDFVLALYEQLPEGQVRPYVCRVDGQFVGGLLALQFGDVVGRWQGGVKIEMDVDVSVNDLLDWTVMVDGIDRGLSTYDLVGADNRRINSYKAKFDPDLRAFHSVERGSAPMSALAHLYQRWGGKV